MTRLHKLISRIVFFQIIFLIPLYSQAEIRFVRAVFNSDASNALTIIWDQVSGKNPVLLYDTVYPLDMNYRYNAGISTSNFSKGMHNQIVRLTGLKANTVYYFCIKDDEGYSSQYNLATAPGSPTDKLSFIAGGDSRDRRPVRQMANLMVAKVRPHAVLFNGDFIGIDIEKQWIEWFEDWQFATASDGRIPVMVVTRGNHELTNLVFEHLFDVPNKRVFYSTTFGGTLLNLVSLNSEILKFGKQKIFLRSTLKDHANYSWQLPQYHRPVRSHVSHKKEMNTQYRNFVPLFEKHDNVRLCLENDSHTCKSTWPIIRSNDLGSEEGFIRNDDKGIVYVGEGCWGAPLRQPDDNKCWTRDSEAINQINWIFISKEKMEVRTIKYDNANSVVSLTDKTRFDMPENIDLWNPSNGAVIEIFPISKSATSKKR